MKKIYTLIILALSMAGSACAQVFDVDTLQYNGNSSKYINIVIMGDGYTSAQQDTFIRDANNLSSYLLNQSPWVNYKGYFNVFAIKVESQQSGTKHPNSASDCGSGVPVSNPLTYFGCTFDAYGIHRLVVPMNTTALVGVLSANFPNYDQVLVVANSPYYGGSGGSFATSTVETNSNEVCAHEVGHSFANLADEYYAGDVYAAEKANMTKVTDTTLVKWKNWMNHKGTGIYQHCCGGNSALWYKPHTNCKMQALGQAFCSVCCQGIIESIHGLVNPLVSYSPVADTIASSNQYLDFKLTELMKPSPNSLQITWKLDGNIVQGGLDSFKLDQNTLSNSLHTLVASVKDTTHLLRVDNHPSLHFSTVTWTIDKTITDVKVVGNANKINCSIYPNPAGDFVNISVEMEKSSSLSIELLSMDGKLIRQIAGTSLVNGLYKEDIDIRDLASGTYLAVFRIGDFVHTETLIKR